MHGLSRDSYRRLASLVESACGSGQLSRLTLKAARARRNHRPSN